MHPYNLRLISIALLVLAAGFFALFIYCIFVGLYYWAIGFFVANLGVSMATRYMKKKNYPNKPDFPGKKKTN